MARQKAKILMLTPWAPVPTDAGSRRIWTACQLLKDRYDFDLLTFSSAPSDDPRRDAAIAITQEKLYFRGLFQNIQLIQRSKDPAPSFENGLALPEEIARFSSPEMTEALTRTLRTAAPDLIHVEFDLMAPYVRTIKSQRPDMPCILTHHDLSALSLFSSYFREMSGWAKWRRLADWRKRLVLTKKLCAQFDAVVTVSEGDRRRMGRWINPNRVHSAPTGVDLKHFSGGPPQQEREQNSLVFVGHYPHYPNEEAVLRFMKQIWPRIKKAKPSAKFYIVGSHPTEKIRALQSHHGIIVTGTVPDVRPFEARAMVMVAPLKLGYGIKGKLLEAMAMGTPVVSTSCANEAIGGIPERHLLIADSPRNFARQTLRLLEDASLWDRLSRDARAFVETRHDWHLRANEIGEIYRGFVAPARERFQSRQENPMPSGTTCG